LTTDPKELVWRIDGRPTASKSLLTRKWEIQKARPTTTTHPSSVTQLLHH